MEDNNAESNVDCGGPDTEVLERINIKDHYYDVLAKNMVNFCNPKNLPEVKLKSFVLLLLAEGTERHSHIDCVLWLLVITHMQIYNGKQQTEQIEIQNVLQLEEKKSTRECHVGDNSCAQGDERFKERPDVKWFKDNGNLRTTPPREICNL